MKGYVNMQRVLIPDICELLSVGYCLPRGVYNLCWTLI